MYNKRPSRNRPSGIPRDDDDGDVDGLAHPGSPANESAALPLSSSFTRREWKFSPGSQSTCEQTAETWHMNKVQVSYQIHTYFAEMQRMMGVAHERANETTDSIRILTSV